MITRIHVNQHVIKRNRKTGENNPPITVKTSKSNTYAHNVDILGPDGKPVATLIYSPQKPLSCGAMLWIETNAELVLK